MKGNGVVGDNMFDQHNQHTHHHYDRNDVEALQAELARVHAYNEKLKERMREEHVGYEDISDCEEQYDGDGDNVNGQGERFGGKTKHKKGGEGGKSPQSPSSQKQGKGGGKGGAKTKN